LKNSFVFAVLVSLIFSYTHIHSQGIFLEKGEFGVFGNGGYTSLESGNATSFGGGVAFGGVIEIGFASTNSNIEVANYYYSDHIEVSSKTFSVGAVLIKKKAQLEVNFGLTTSDKGGDAVLIGFNVGSEFVLHEKISWYPIFSFAVGISLEKNSGNPVTALGLTVPFLISNHVYLGPSFGLSESNFSWGITGGIIISFDIGSTGGWGDSN
jgi:hypothetical protein